MVSKSELDNFYAKASLLLDDTDLDYLYNILKEYDTFRSIDKLVLCLCSCLDTADKLELLKDVRHLIPPQHLQEFDGIAPYQYMSSERNHSLSSGQCSKEGRGGRLKVCLSREEGRSLGFSVRGGSEHKLGIYVSHVDPQSQAEKRGLRIGDQIVEANRNSFHNITMARAVSILTGSTPGMQLQIMVNRVGIVPDSKLACIKTSWYDTHERRVMASHRQAASYQKRGTESPSVLKQLSITGMADGDVLGFNIRGGREFGVGIFVSRVDSEGPAERAGLKPGDQILDCNGQTFINLSHKEAVQFLRSQASLLFTVKELGMYPVSKEVYADYRWTPSTMSASNPNISYLKTPANMEQSAPSTSSSISATRGRKKKKRSRSEPKLNMLSALDEIHTHFTSSDLSDEYGDASSHLER